MGVKRVLICGFTENQGGMESYIMAIYRCCDRSKLQFDFLNFHTFPIAYEEEIRALGGEIYYIPMKSVDYKGHFDALESLFSKAFTIRLIWQGIMVGALTLGAYWLGEYVLGDPLTADATANTMAFATLTLSQLFHAFDVRSEDQSIFQIGFFSNKAMNEAFLIGLAMQMSVLCLPPLQSVFSVVFLRPVEWLVVMCLAVTPILLCEIEKLIRRIIRRRHN